MTHERGESIEGVFNGIQVLAGSIINMNPDLLGSMMFEELKIEPVKPPMKI